MKKKRLIVVVALIIALSLSNVSFASGAIKVYVGNSRLVMEVEPIIQDGRTLVPLRAIFEALGADIQWSQESRTVTGTLGATTVSLQINSKTAYINGVPIEVEVPAVIQSEIGRAHV